MVDAHHHLVVDPLVRYYEHHVMKLQGSLVVPPVVAVDVPHHSMNLWFV